MADRLFVVGMMGAGKSTVARLAAARLGWEWLDTDEEIVRRTGASVPELFARDGEASFRAQESLVLAAALDRAAPLVVSVGGGAVLDEANRALMGAAGTVVWLRARPDTLAARVGDGTGRPLLAGDAATDTAATVRRLDGERRARYEEVADVVIDVDDREPQAVADRLLELVGLSAAGPPVRS